MAITNMGIDKSIQFFFQGESACGLLYIINPLDFNNKDFDKRIMFRADVPADFLFTEGDEMLQYLKDKIIERFKKMFEIVCNDSLNEDTPGVHTAKLITKG